MWRVADLQASRLICCDLHLKIILPSSPYLLLKLFVILDCFMSATNTYSFLQCIYSKSKKPLTTNSFEIQIRYDTYFKASMTHQHSSHRILLFCVRSWLIWNWSWNLGHFFVSILVDWFEMNSSYLNSRQTWPSEITKIMIIYFFWGVFSV